MPKDVIIKNYECEFCGNRFETFDECKEHEFDSHKCPNCEFGYYVYGCEFECELLNNECECSFNPNKNFILGKLRKLYHERDEYFEMAEKENSTARTMTIIAFATTALGIIGSFMYFMLLL